LQFFALFCVNVGSGPTGSGDPSFFVPFLSAQFDGTRFGGLAFLGALHGASNTKVFLSVWTLLSNDNHVHKSSFLTPSGVCKGLFFVLLLVFSGWRQARFPLRVGFEGVFHFSLVEFFPFSALSPMVGPSPVFFRLLGKFTPWPFPKSFLNPMVFTRRAVSNF